MLLFLYIRFSQKRQRDGNSIRRQLEYAINFCEKEKITFDPESQTFADEGVSSHRGAHRREGREGGLAEFLSLCHTGVIPRGSFLLVESFDRLSREHPFDAMDLLRKLLREYGIILIVIRPEMRLNAASLGQLEGIMAFLEALRSYSESAAKSDRSKDNWKVKRRDAATKIVSGRVPSWLTVEDGKIVKVPEKTAVVRRIFEMARKGAGSTTIARTLDAEGVRPISRGDRWDESYIHKLLKSRQVLGEYQPRMLADGRLVPVGEVVENYYPQVITTEEWVATRQAVASRRGRRGWSSPRKVDSV